MPFTKGRLANVARAAAAVALFGVMMPAAQPVEADGGGVVGKKLRCWFTTRAPGPGQTIDRRFQEVVIIGQCNRPVEQIPRIFADGNELEVQGGGVTNRFRFSGLSSVFGVSVGEHRLAVVVEPRDASVQPFVSRWTFFAQ